ncbi:42191_t:CDS:2, partial [Gigaspora margarita]
MQFEDSKSGWLTKLGGNALRKTWKRRWFLLRGNSLFYYRQKDNPEPAGVINLSTYNSVSQDSTATKKSSYCIRIEKTIRENDSINSTLSYNSRSIKKPTTFLVFADTESEMFEWISALEKRLGGRNIVDIVLDRLELSGGMHRRQASYSSLSSFYSKNSGFETPNLVAMFGLGQPILRKPASCSGLQDKKTNNNISGGNTHPTHPIPHRKLSLTFNKEPTRAQTTPLIMVHGENTKVTSSLDTMYFLNNHVIKSSPLSRKKVTTYLDQSVDITPSSPITPIAN